MTNNIMKYLITYYVRKITFEMALEISDYAIEINRYILSPIGLWPISKQDTFFSRHVNKLRIICTYWLVLFNVLPCALFTFLEEVDPTRRITWYGPMTFSVMAILKLSFLILGKDTLVNCYEHIEWDWKESLNCRQNHLIMQKNAKIGRIFSSICAIFMYGGVMFYHIIIPYVRKGIHPKNLDNVTIIRPLSYPVYSKLMINVQSTPFYEIVYTLQVISGFATSTITIGLCSISAVFVMHTCGQLDIVMYQLDHLISNTNLKPLSLRKGISAIVNRHIRALSFAGQLESFLSSLCLVEIVGCTLCICLLGYYIIAAWQINDNISVIIFVIILVSFMFNIFIFCYIGEILTEQCRKIGEVSYAVDWYRIPGNKALDLSLVILAASLPVKITAGKLIDLTLVSFSVVLKTSAIYMNLLRKLTI